MHDKLMQLGAETLVKTIEGLCNKTLSPTPQTEIAIESLKHAPKLFTETCQINWNASANTIHNLVRGLSPYPAAFTHLQEKKLKVFESKAEITTHNFEIGKPFTDQKSYLKFSCKDGFVHILDLQLEGKKRMLVQDFLRGYRFE
jgi:methionyl-tRNA formyltransferase